ncbi:Scramblase [Ancylostoma caninum]|uniref:Phospholipid scramblase n=1 Tax=Ancylostoma caninum TaxID=29170 RepID=A0A368GXB7_ANCCA|nr:Scramblase [Ancylostoma caninum]
MTREKVKGQDVKFQELIRVKRRFKCCFCLNDNETKLCACCCCCRESMKVESPPGNQIGNVYQTCGTMLRFNICDASGGRIARIVGPSFLGMGCCTCCFPSKVFKIYSDNGTEIGSITKKFGGFFKELLTNADVFHVECRF